MQFRLRTLLIVLAVGPALLAVGWLNWQAYLLQADAQEPLIQTFVYGRTNLPPTECLFGTETASLNENRPPD